MGQIPARNNDQFSYDFYNIYDINESDSLILFGDTWSQFQTRSDEVTQMPEFARATVPIAILMGHIITASYIRRIKS